MRFGITHLVDVLAGKETDKVHGFGHHRLSVFGIADEAELALMKPVARALLARDALRADEYGGLSFGPADRPLLKGEEPMELDHPPKIQRRRGERVPNPEGDPQFEALPDCRRALDTEEAGPPYLIFPIRTPREKRRAKPTPPG